jgi:hypothetical protein
VFTAFPPAVTLPGVAAKEKTSSRLLAWLAPILLLLAAVAAAQPASALTASAAETRAWEKTSFPLESRLDESLQLLNLHQQNEVAGYDDALGSPLAAESTAARVATGDTYSVAFQTELKATSYPGVSRGLHFQEANENLLQMMESDPQFAQTMQDAGVNLQRTPTGLAPRTPPAGWTWHHAEDPGVLQLVPRVQHTPGSIFWDTLHPDGQGGYAIWGK